MSRLAVAVAALLLLPLGAGWADDPKPEQTKEKVPVVEADSLGVVDQGVPGVTAPDSKGKSSAAVDHTKPGKVESKVIMATTKGDGKKIGQLNVPLNVPKATTRKLKAAGRPKSVTIVYADGSKETIGLDDCDSLTLNVTAGTVSLAKHPKVFSYVQIQVNGKPPLQSIPAATKSHVITGTVVKEHKVHEKKGTGIEDRLGRLEQTLLKLQQEIKALKNK